MTSLQICENLNMKKLVKLVKNYYNENLPIKGHIKFKFIRCVANKIT